MVKQDTYLYNGTWVGMACANASSVPKGTGGPPSPPHEYVYELSTGTNSKLAIVQ